MLGELWHIPPWEIREKAPLTWVLRQAEFSNFRAKIEKAKSKG